MLAPTHLIFGQTAYLGTCIATGHIPTHVEALVAASGALLPDLDKRQSIVGRLLFPLTGWLEYQFGHRTFTHALVFQLIAGLILYHTIPFGWFLAVMSGWISHSFADMMTPSGVCWLWPSQVRCIFPGNEDYRVEVMSYGELGIAIVAALLAFPLLFWAQKGEGTLGLVQAALGRIESARTQYDGEKGDWFWSLEIKGKNNTTFADINGTYHVRGPWRESGFLVETSSGPVTVCRATTCAWYPEHAVLVRGNPEHTTTRTLTAERTTGADLAEKIRPLQEAGRVYVLGTLNARRAAAQPPTVEVTAEMVTLNYATPGDLARIGPVQTANLAVQVRHPPNTVVPELTAPAAKPSLDPLLERWIR